MTYYGPKELSEAFRTVRTNTIKIAEEIPEESYSYRPAPQSRSIAETLIHLVASTRFPERIHFTERLTNMEGFDFFTLMGEVQAEEKKSYTKDQILEMLRSNNNSYSQLLANATEDFLAQTVAFPAGMTPPTKSRFEMLMSTKEHEMHHRGQLMVFQRILGMTPHLTRQMEEFIASHMASQNKA